MFKKGSFIAITCFTPTLCSWSTTNNNPPGLISKPTVWKTANDSNIYTPFCIYLCPHDRFAQPSKLKSLARNVCINAGMSSRKLVVKLTDLDRDLKSLTNTSKTSEWYISWKSFSKFYRKDIKIYSNFHGHSGELQMRLTTEGRGSRNILYCPCTIAALPWRTECFAH